MNEDPTFKARSTQMSMNPEGGRGQDDHLNFENVWGLLPFQAGATDGIGTDRIQEVDAIFLFIFLKLT